MIPSSPLRTWIFLVLSSLAFYTPVLLMPAEWDKNTNYLLFYIIYQGALVLAGFWYGPAICRSLVVRTVVAGPLRQAVDRTLVELRNNKGLAQLAVIPVTLAEYSVPFIVTAGLLPAQSQVFLSSALVERLGANGLRFLLARALLHGSLPQRLAALLPVLVLTAMIPDTPSSILAWLELAGFLMCWLLMHWFFELRADSKAAQALGPAAAEGLRELWQATASTPGATPVWLSLQAPIRWRMHIVAGA
jgi:hypothetical protein